jgi:hypothetical protein
VATSYFKRNKETGEIIHKEKKNLNIFKGNFTFSSVNKCLGLSSSRKDDLESLLYLFVYLLNNLSLPWIEKWKER